MNLSSNWNRKNYNELPWVNHTLDTSSKHKLFLYALLEVLVGRDRLYRLGRFIYLGARRELINDPEINGEYALIDWALAGAADEGRSGVLLDVGANLGDWSAAAIDRLDLRQSKDGIKLIAFEPAPKQREAFANRHAQSISKKILSLRDCALGLEQGRVRFELTGSDSGTSSIQAVKQGSDRDVIEVDLQTVDAVLAQEGIDRVLLLKVDTEGNDFNVILGAHQSFVDGRISIMQFEYNWRWIDFGHCLKHVFDFAAPLDLCLGKLTKDCIEVYETWNPELDRYIETNFVLVRRAILEHLPHKRMDFSQSNTPLEVPG